MSTRVFRCPTCLQIEQRQQSLHAPAEALCSQCETPMRSYFGKHEGNDVLVNYGYRESRYANLVDARIAEYQFTNL